MEFLFPAVWCEGGAACPRKLFAIRNRVRLLVQRLSTGLN